MIRSAFALVAVIAFAASGAQAAEPEPAGYRGPPYRAEVPETLAGAMVIDDKAARALWWSGRITFVDVLPAPRRPDNLSEGTIWRDPPHETIPGAIWLPNTGYEGLAPEALDYFIDGLAEAGAGDADAPLVFFCRAECWMSWNAGRRAIEQGFTRVYWYPAGTDGWSAGGWDLQTTLPFGDPPG